MLEKGRFFGASVPEQPHRYVVGIAANDDAARQDVIWYLEKMGIPWAQHPDQLRLTTPGVT
ncbi:MAG: hypothetical protein KDK29_11345 [Sedimentitalea sp.]|nr:hypothetical protein [Sedimentitalea sp.]